jgi:hypothetical protein
MYWRFPGRPSVICTPVLLDQNRRLLLADRINYFIADPDMRVEPRLGWLFPNRKEADDCVALVNPLLYRWLQLLAVPLLAVHDNESSVAEDRDHMMLDPFVPLIVTVTDKDLHGEPRLTALPPWQKRWVPKATMRLPQDSLLCG